MSTFKEKLNRLVDRYNELSDLLVTANNHQDIAKYSKEHSDLSKVVETILRLRSCEDELNSLEELKLDEDSDIRTMAYLEWDRVKKDIEDTNLEIKCLLLPKDVDDEKNVIIEVRAGTGGEEAGLFAAVLFRMYQRYSLLKGWNFEILSLDETGLGAIKDASASIQGKGVFARLKFESGVHRVQRVPETESSGRIHTSTATVAVLPEVEDVDIHIDEKDLHIDVFRASGAGGQHVNTTDSAVRITHIPSGIVVSQQDERSQHKNKAKALKILRAKLYDAEREKRTNEQAKQRKSQVGSGDRSERIRTYNYPQGRVSDHRINLTLYKIDQIVEGGALDELIDALISHDQAEKMLESEID